MKINKGITVFYFSATGNSLHAAHVISSQYIKSELIKIEYSKIERHPNNEVVGFIFPVYMGTLPDIVELFLENFPFEKGVYYFAIGTYYKYKGSALSAANKILINRGINLSYAGCVPTVGNCLMEYEVSEHKRPKILTKAESLTKIIAIEIRNEVIRIPLRYSKLSDKIHKWLFKTIFGKAYKKFTLDASCISCGRCVKVCPVKNISLLEGKPQWGKTCTACHACVHWCPKNAINVGGSKGRLRYHNPTITIDEIVRV